jgi:hypothetical protein
MVHHDLASALYFQPSPHHGIVGRSPEIGFQRKENALHPTA